MTTPLDIPGCILWLDAADAATVTQTAGNATSWTSKGSAVTKAVSMGTAPRWGDVLLNGKKTINFPLGVSDRYQLDGTWTVGAQPFTIMFVLKLHTKSTAFISDNTSGGRIFTAGDSNWRMHAGTGLPDSGVASDLNWHILTFVFNGTASRIYLDRTVILGGVTTDPGPDLLRAGWSIPGDGAAAMCFAEVTGHTGALSGTNLSSLEQYAYDKWFVAPPPIAGTITTAWAGWTATAAGYSAPSSRTAWSGWTATASAVTKAPPAPWIPDDNCETHEWRSSTGETIRFVTMVEAEQRFMPPVTIHTVRVPQAQGGRFRHARHEERLVTIPVVTPGPTSGRDELRRWAKALDPLKGEGTLTVVEGAHAGRQLTCVYETGLETLAEEWPTLGLTTIAFRAADPYWHDATESTLISEIGETSLTWFPFLPLTFNVSDVFGHATIDNTGDVDAWPIITALGPGDDLVVANDTTGQAWRFTGNIPAGSTLEVDHRPGHKSVRLGGVNAFGRLDDTSVLWPLIPGPNRISIAFVHATTESQVRFTWQNRWLSA